MGCFEVDGGLATADSPPSTPSPLSRSGSSEGRTPGFIGRIERLGDGWPPKRGRLSPYVFALRIALAVAAVRFRATLAGQPAPAGAATARVLGGYRRTAADRGRGQAAPLRADGLAAILATAARPRTDGRGVERRFTAAARAAGIEARVTAHSGRVGLASELTARGASTTEVMLAGNWKTARMVAHYSAGATAERGAVRKYL